ncbi:uncharacterized protein LOC134254765 [Saccostrea cucullata]|uniref:uncharacterized protein LOC134254765 n=1 Tax=Saccostrea cuccullata TaxID=36930 RepID=UPI002ED229CF
MHWQAFLLILVIFIINEGTSLSEKNAGDNGVFTGVLDSQRIERHREKRRILGAEHQYFRTYFSEKGLLSVYNRLRRNGLIDDWRPLGVTSYSNAIQTSTEYYMSRAEAGVNVNAQVNRIEGILAYRRQDARDHGGGDERHNATIINWQSGLERIRGGQERYNECRRIYTIHDELKKRSVRYRGWNRRRFSSRRGGSRGRLQGNRGGRRRYPQSRGRTGRLLVC